MTVPPLLGSSPLRPYKRCEVGVHFFLTPSYMARDYESKAMEKFLLPSQPDKGNFTLRTAYENMLKAYQRDHMCVMEACEQWKQGEWIEDMRQEAEAARAQAAAKKECREAAAWSRNHRHLEEGGGQERVNELTEVHVEVDCNMVCAMHDLTPAMGCANMGVLLVVGAGVPGVSMGVGWLGEHEEGTSKEKGKGKERAVVEDEGEGAEGAGEGWGGLDDWTEGGGDRHDDGGDEDGCDDDAPNVEYIG